MNPTIQSSFENDITSDVPGILKRVVRTIAYTFYQPCQIAICNILLKHIIVDEDSMSLLLKIEKKQLRSMILPLKNDRLVRFKTIKEKIEETGQYLTFTFYYINFQMYLNVIKYKLESLKRKIVHTEDVNRLRPSYTCTNCKKGFSDLDMSRLINMKTGDLTCYMCYQPVKENEESKQQMMNRTLLAKFNQQFNYLYKLVDKCCSVDFDDKLIEPSLNKFYIERAIICRNSNEIDVVQLFQSNLLQANKTKRMLLNNPYKQQFSIKFEDNETEITNDITKVQSKEFPDWLKHTNLQVNETEKLTNTGLYATNLNNNIIEENINDDIDELLKYENLNEPIKEEIKKTNNNLDFDLNGLENSNNLLSITDTGENEKKINVDLQSQDTTNQNIFMSENTQDCLNEEIDMYLTIGGEKVHFNDVTPLMEENMTDEERGNYVKILNAIDLNFF